MILEFIGWYYDILYFVGEVLPPEINALLKM